MSRLFGDVIQNGYVVRDIETAMRHWIDILGVGPWFYIEQLPVPDFQYKGQPSPVDVSLALANSGTLQIELIQQRNDAPSMYRDFLAAGHEVDVDRLELAHALDDQVVELGTLHVHLERAGFELDLTVGSGRHLFDDGVAVTRRIHQSEKNVEPQLGQR